MIQLARKILGFESPHSWMKWVRIPLIAVMAYISAPFWFQFGPEFVSQVLAGNIFGAVLGAVFALILILIIFGPMLAVVLGVTIGIGALVGMVLSGRKQAKSLKDSAAAGQDILNLDKQRLKSQFLGPVLLVIWIAVLIGCSAAIGNLGGKAGEVVGILIAISFMLFGALLLFIHYQNRRQYQTTFKEQIVRNGFAAFLDDLLFDPERSLDGSAITESRLFPDYNSFSGNDYLAASYKGRKFVQSDILLRKRYEKIRGISGVKTLFEGRLMIFDFDALSNEPVIVRDRRMGGAAGGIRTELEAFNRIFAVEAADGVSAFRILTPPVIEGITLAFSKLDSPMSLSFVNNKIYVAVANGDSFEAASVGDETLSEQRDRIQREMRAVLDIVETLYLTR